MMAGDFGFNDFANGIDYEIKYFILALSVVILPIVLNNILMSFSITDAKEVLDSAELCNLKTEVEFLAFSNYLFVVSTQKVTLEKDESMLSKMKHLFVDSVESIIKSVDPRATAIYIWRKDEKIKYKDDDDDDATNNDILARITDLEAKFNDFDKSNSENGDKAANPNASNKEVLARISSLEDKINVFQHQVLEVLKNFKRN